MSEGTLTQSISSRIRPDTITQLRHYAALDGLTPSAWISHLVTQEINRRKVASASTAVSDHV